SAEPTGDEVGDLLLLELVLRIDPALVLEEVDLSQRLRPLIVLRLVREARDRDRARLADHALVFLERDLEALGHLEVRRRAAQLDLEGLPHLVDAIGLVPDDARHPIERAQLIEDGAANPGRAIGLEFHPPIEIEPIHGVHETEDSGALQIVELAILGQLREEPFGDIADEWQIALDQDVAQALIARRLEPAPHLFDLSRVRLRSLRAYHASTSLAGVLGRVPVRWLPGSRVRAGHRLVVVDSDHDQGPDCRGRRLSQTLLRRSTRTSAPEPTVLGSKAERARSLTGADRRQTFRKGAGPRDARREQPSRERVHGNARRALRVLEDERSLASDGAANVVVLRDAPERLDLEIEES